MHKLTARELREKIFRSRFFTVSVVIHAAIVMVLSVTVLFRNYVEPPDFTGGDSAGFVSSEPAAQPAAQQQAPQAPTFTVQTPTVPIATAVPAITTTGFSPVVLPSIPAPSGVSKDFASKIPVGGGGSGSGSKIGGGGSGSGGSMFGATGSAKGGALVGVLYDTGQTPSHRRSGMDRDRYLDIVKDFAANGFNSGKLSKYYKAPRKLYATQIFIPVIKAEEGPKAFEAGKDVGSALWLVFYKGSITPDHTGTYRLAAWGDDVLAIRLADKLVMENDTSRISGYQVGKRYTYDFGRDSVHGNGFYRAHGHALSEPLKLVAGTYYNFEVALGETDGGASQFQILFEEEGATYEKDAVGNPILPVLRFDTELPKTVLDNAANLPPFKKDGPVWKVQ